MVSPSYPLYIGRHRYSGKWRTINRRQPVDYRRWGSRQSCTGREGDGGCDRDTPCVGCRLGQMTIAVKRLHRHRHRRRARRGPLTELRVIMSDKRGSYLPIWSRDRYGRHQLHILLIVQCGRSMIDERDWPSQNTLCHVVQISKGQNRHRDQLCYGW